MAIVKMQKLDLLAARSQKDELLRELMRLGCVELREQEELLAQAEETGGVGRETSDAAEWRGKRNSLAEAIRLLDKYAPAKSPLLAPKPEVEEQRFLDVSELEQNVETARQIVSLDERLRSCTAEEARQKLFIESLKPWRGLDLPLENGGTKQVALLLGTVPAAVELGAVSNALGAAAECSQLTEITSDENLRYLSVLFFRNEEDKVMPVLREYGFAAPAFGTARGTAEENIRQAEQEIAGLEMEKASCSAQLAGMGKHRDALKLCYDRCGSFVDRAEAAEKLLKTDKVVSLQGWVAEPGIPALKKLLDGFGCAYEFSVPAEEEYDDVPVKLENNKLTHGLNMVTDMYSLPRYGTVDPNPVMAPFFILFYGIMMADMGYGLIMMLVGLLIMLKKKPKKGFIRTFGELMIEGGVATFIMGAITGGFFGDAPEKIVKLFNPDSTFTGLPALFTPLGNTVEVLAGAMVLGFIQLVTGMVISFVQKKKHGHLMDGIWEEGTTWVILLGVILTAAGKLGGISALQTPGLVILIIGIVMLFYASGRNARGIGKVTSVFGAVYNGLTGWFGDILSYSRLMALMLAGSVIAQVFNTLGALPGNIIVFILIFVVGHALNFGLNLLGCYVHDLRLQCLEYFGKFYTDGGKPFRPLAMNTKYVDVVKK